MTILFYDSPPVFNLRVVWLDVVSSPVVLLVDILHTRHTHTVTNSGTVTTATRRQSKVDIVVNSPVSVGKSADCADLCPLSQGLYIIDDSRAILVKQLYLKLEDNLPLFFSYFKSVLPSSPGPSHISMLPGAREVHSSI